MMLLQADEQMPSGDQETGRPAQSGRQTSIDPDDMLACRHKRKHQRKRRHQLKLILKQQLWQTYKQQHKQAPKQQKDMNPHSSGFAW
ncbi:unnamed protein product [Protopolystoma xenopodis]|uniref:Uncharacterized protein n=1 Tax=Protopolystoma xenopodis TaxID=117903 RepID=A0A448XR53_9PLAT|nr:unnamed protein product [Protopolystoma xenopodis]